MIESVGLANGLYLCLCLGSEVSYTCLPDSHTQRKGGRKGGDGQHLDEQQIISFSAMGDLSLSIRGSSDS